jgi:hypothetical protein
MRIVEPTLAMFLSEIKKLEEHTFQMAEASERYLQSKKQYGQAHYTTKDWRDVLDNRLHAYKLIISNIYDIMHDRGLTNFESGPVENDPPKYYPLRIEPKLDPDDALMFALVARLNPLMIRGLDGESTINIARSDGSSNEVHAEEAKGDEGSTTDLQSSGTTGTVGSLQGESKESDHKRESSDAYSLAEHVL